MKHKAAVFTLAILVLVVGAFSRAGAQGTGSEKTLVVFLKRIIDESKEGRELVGKLRKDIEVEKQKIAKKVEVLKATMERLQETESTARDPKWYEEYQATLKEMTDLKANEQYFVTKINDDIGRKLNDIIRGAQEHARRIMRERNAEIVLISRMGPITIQSDQELQSEIISRRVFCAAGEVDITTEVLTRMNREFEENN